MAEQNAFGIFNLIIEKLAKILHIHFALVYIDNNNGTIQNGIFNICGENGARNVAQLTDTGGLD